MSKRAMSAFFRGGALMLAITTIAACDNNFRFPNDPKVAIVCDEGFVLFLDTISGDDETGCIPRDTIVVHGFVTTSFGHPIEGVTVTAYPWVDDPPADGEEPADDAVLPVQTNADGYFRLMGGNTTRNVLVHYSHPDYTPQTQDMTFLINDDSVSLGYIAMDGSTEMEVMYNPAVGGHVYAGDAPAVGATVILYDTAAGINAALTTTGANGDFSFADLWDGNFNLRVMPFDEDGDGISDYRYNSISLGNITTQNSLNLSNLIVSLDAIEKEILYANFLGFTGPVTAVTGSTTLVPATGFNRLFDPSSNILLHFGAETIPSTLDIWLRPYEPGTPGGYGDPIAITSTWSNGDTVLTIDPAMDLTADDNEDTLYALRINTLLFADGTHFVRQTEADSWVEFRFDISDNNTPLTSPNDLAFYFTDRRNPTQTTTSVDCDSFGCWLLDAGGSFFGGWSDISGGGGGSAFFNENNGFAMSWSHIPGAVDYEVYARRRSTSSTADGLSNWYNVSATIASGTSDPNFDGTIYATGVLNGEFATTFDPLGIGTLSEGAELDIAVIAIDQEGFESPLDSSLALTISDGFAPFVENSDVNDTTGTGVHANSTELGNSGLRRNAEVIFSEFMDTGVDPSVEFGGGNITSTGAPDFVSWGGPGATPENLSQTALIGPFDMSIRGVCTEVTCDVAMNENDILCVRDSSIIGNGDLFILTSGGAFLDVASVSSKDDANNLLTLSPIPTFDISTGDIACTAAPVDNTNLTTLTGAASADTTLQVGNPEYFYVGMDIAFLDNVSGTDAAQIRTVSAVRTGTGEIDVTGALTEEINVLISPNWEGGGEYPLRAADELDIVDDVTSGATTTIEVATFAGNPVMVGDDCLVDLDGNVNTFDDRFYGSVTALSMAAAAPPANTITLGAPSAGLPAIPAGSLIVQGVAQMTCLGDNLRVTGAPADTSGNALGEFDRVSECAPATFGCSNFAGNVLVH